MPIAWLREAAPLVHNITNFVAITATANALLAISAAPAMVCAIREVRPPAVVPILLSVRDAGRLLLLIQINAAHGRQAI